MQGWQNRFGRPSDRQTNVGCMVPERLADANSEIRNPEIFLPITGGRSTLALVRQNTVGALCICTGCEVADYLLKVHLMVACWHEKYTIIRGLGAIYRNTFCETFSFKINSFQNSPLRYIDSSISFVVVKTL